MGWQILDLAGWKVAADVVFEGDGPRYLAGVVPWGAQVAAYEPQGSSRAAPGTWVAADLILFGYDGKELGRWTGVTLVQWEEFSPAPQPLAWFPDGKRLVIGQRAADGSSNLAVFDVSTVEAVPLPDSGKPMSWPPGGLLFTTAGEAARTAAEFGFPVVLKVASSDILHKSKLGGVEVDLRTPDEVTAAFDRILAGVRRAAPEAKVDGCLVSEQAPRGLAEVIVGTTRDAEFGRVVMFGAGGEFTEVLKCVDFRSLPITATEARRMVDKVRGRMMAAAGWKRIDPAVPAELVRRFGDLLQAHPEIESLDINPAVIYEDRYVVVDAKGIVAK